MDTIPYGTVATSSLPFAEAVEHVKSALKDEGFGVLCEIDIQKAMKDKLGREFRPYTILGSCNPHLAHEALCAEPQLGLLLPCNVVVQEQDGHTTISAVDARKMLEVVGSPHMEAIAGEANVRLQRVIAHVRS